MFLFSHKDSVSVYNLFASLRNYTTPYKSLKFLNTQFHSLKFHLLFVLYVAFFFLSAHLIIHLNAESPSTHDIVLLTIFDLVFVFVSYFFIKRTLFFIAMKKFQEYFWNKRFPLVKYSNENIGLAIQIFKNNTNANNIEQEFLTAFSKQPD